MSFERALTLHRNYFGVEPKAAVFAPGRINLIGEHTDYNGGFVMPCAIDRGIWVVGRIVDGESKLMSDSAGPGKPFDSANPDRKPTGWAKYPAGMASVLTEPFGIMPNIEATVVSNLPMGSGVSSSAAMELAFAKLYQALTGFEASAKQLALLGQKCENQYVGVNCGIMDQMASACGKKNHAICIDTRSLEIEYAPVDPSLAVVLLDTKKPRALTDSAYNERRSQCEAAAAAIGVPQLRDANLEMLLAKKSELNHVTFRRARHVVTEDARSIAFKSALATRDRNGIFALMKGSHDSLRDDYEVSCAELDAMVNAAWLAPGVFGARMTGAGFGGACVALVARDEVEDFCISVLPIYKKNTGKDGEAIVCGIDDGARVLS
ncbi:MAG: galactokinase [Armatimonadota bacterium]